MKTYFVALTEDLHPVEEQVYSQFGRTVEVQMEDEPQLQDGKYLRSDVITEKIDIKKDSGFGSQGALEVEKIKVTQRELAWTDLSGFRLSPSRMSSLASAGSQSQSRT